MEGLESALLKTLAETSFNYLAAGAIIGLVAGVVIAWLLTRR
jgi:high-affinity Fe2+/Pb2+ permease